jgi:hypothetical protein
LLLHRLSLASNSISFGSCQPCYPFDSLLMLLLLLGLWHSSSSSMLLLSLLFCL